MQMVDLEVFKHAERSLFCEDVRIKHGTCSSQLGKTRQLGILEQSPVSRNMYAY